jgi:membrane associated rhomboid family serine protease
MLPTELLWMTAALGLAAVLCLDYVLGRLIASRVVHGILGAVAMVGAFAVIEYLHPWENPSLWVKVLVPCLVGLAVAQFSQAIRGRPGRNAP